MPKTWDGMKRYATKMVTKTVQVEEKVELPFIDGFNKEVPILRFTVYRNNGYPKGAGEFYFEVRTRDISKSNGGEVSVYLDREHLIAMRDTINDALNG